MVIKERKKRAKDNNNSKESNNSKDNNNKVSKFIGIQPVGLPINLNIPNKAMPIQQQQPRKDIDPLVKLEL